MDFFAFLNKLAIFAKCNKCSIGRIHYDFSAPRYGEIALKTRKKVWHQLFLLSIAFFVDIKSWSTLFFKNKSFAKKPPFFVMSARKNRSKFDMTEKRLLLSEIVFAL